MIARVLLLFVLLTGIAGAQVYRWTDENGKVHYGDKPPAGSTARAIGGGTTLSVPLPKPSALDLERQRQIEEATRKSDQEREAKEQAAFRNSPQGISQCQRMEQDIRDAQQGEIRQASGTRKLGAAEREEILPLLIAHRDKICR